MAGQSMLPPPAALEIHDTQAAEKWKRFKRAWVNYALATGLSEKDEAIQVAALLTVIAREVFSTFSDWEHAGDSTKIEPVLAKFEQYCKPCKNVPFERYIFNRRTQEPGETYDQYRTALVKLAESCSFHSITPEELLRDRLVFGIKDTKTREQLLREPALTLRKTDEICHAAESMLAQLKVVEEGSMVNFVNKDRRGARQPGSGPNDSRQDYSRNCECWNFGRRHDTQRRESCPAFGKRCAKCRKLNHFAARCRSSGPPSVRPVASSGEPEDTEEIFQTVTQLVTLRLDSGNHIRFQVDTGAQCNVVPLSVYKKATKDTGLTQLSPSRKHITAYGGATLPVVGTVLLRVWRSAYHCLLDCKLVDRTDIRPLLGRKACLGMKIVTYLDNDQLHKPDTGNAPVYSVVNTSPLSLHQLIKQHLTILGKGVGRLEGSYHIRLDETVAPAQHAPRKVQVKLREALRRTLVEMTQQGIIAPVRRPTQWISSMVIVPKKNGTMRICLDPQDLNRAIQREHYPLPTIEDIATRLHGAKVLSVLDVSKGFWHIELDEPSSYLTTFHTPFGRYRWKRMRRMHELIEGLQGVEVIADDFMTVGYGKTHEEAVSDHDACFSPEMRREQYPTQPRQSQTQVDTCPIYWPHSDRQGFVCRPCQSRCNTTHATTHRRCWSAALPGNGAVPE